MTAETPVESQRKVGRGELVPGCPAHAEADGTWRIQDYATARAFLRRHDTRQAGFAAENAARMKDRMRLPVLYRDGAEHREHRRRTAKYFTPRRVDTAYRDLMNRLADEQCERLRQHGEMDLSQLSFALAVAVTGEIIGLTEGRGSMARRLNRFFHNPGDTMDPRTPRGIWNKLRSSYTVGMFYWRDVRPAVAVRRRARRDDLISHLIDEGCRGSEILGECITFAAAGMVTTREFIVAAVWHLCTDDDLRAAYLNGDEPRRLAILHELLRLEPVVGNLYRRTTVDVPLGDAVVPAGALVDVNLAATNLDPEAVGAEPGAVCPGRSRADGVGDAVLSFGDGPHRCPGAYIAVQETDIFLTKVFALPGLRMVREPAVRLRPEIASYELTGLRLRVG
ncbi:cytochrome P450 [Jidongwangia harbinensis]|uniref:cytochrome P450 n=1 Tax=Jidongwangia harbinensis TaxID=2878561 RepID=UPI001CDA2B17|nr:cytochrome P450 [Jidongwangia harbinensis]MCA2217693.1 cytochrome P450 [Jidongwangia harbinensis]